MYRLYRLRDSTTLALWKHLIQALLWPLVDYCFLALCNISADQDKRLQVVLNTGIRYIFGARRDEHIAFYRRELSWITNVDRRLYFAATLFYKLKQSGQPDYLANFFLCRVSNRPSRSVMNLLVVPKHDHEALGNSFHISTTYIWNSLPSTIRDLRTLASFKTLLYNFIFNLEVTFSFHKRVFKFQEVF